MSAPRLPTAAELRALGRRDPALGRALRRLPPYPGFPVAADLRRSHYDALARAIVYQQITGKAARTILGRVSALTPGPRFPSPPDLLALDDDTLRGAGLSRGKVAAVRDLARRVTSGELSLRSLGRRSDADVVEHLVQVRGIGVWSAQMFLMFRLGRLDVMPSGDLGVQEGLRLLHGLDARPAADDAARLAEPWRPLRSVGAWFMWRVVEARRGR